MADIWADFAPYTAAIGGTLISTAANTGAALIAGDAAKRGAQIQADALLRAQQQVQEADQRARQQYADMQLKAAPGQNYLRQVVADPGALTPEQQQQLADSRLSTSNTLNSSNFAGSGRAGATLLKRNESDLVNSMLEANRQRSMGAATTLAGQGQQAGMAIGTTDTNEGTQLAKLTGAAGKVQGEGEAKAGLFQGQSTVANGAVTGKAIGDIGSYIASQSKLGRYGNASPTTADVTGPSSYTRDSSYENGNSASTDPKKTTEWV